jgi:hypothetical protein
MQPLAGMVVHPSPHRSRLCWPLRYVWSIRKPAARRADRPRRPETLPSGESRYSPAFSADPVTSSKFSVGVAAH